MPLPTIRGRSRKVFTPGLASLVVQTQVFFTIFLSMRLTGERVALYQIVALLIAGCGLATIALHTDGTATPLGLALVLVATASAGLAVRRMLKVTGAQSISRP